MSGVVVYNGWMLLTFVLAGVTMYTLVRALTGQPPAALVAAVIFAFYPFRFEHYSHFELQFSFWMPLVLLAFHRMLARGRVRDAVLTGLPSAPRPCPPSTSRSFFPPTSWWWEGRSR